MLLRIILTFSRVFDAAQVPLVVCKLSELVQKTIDL